MYVLASQNAYLLNLVLPPLVGCSLPRKTRKQQEREEKQREEELAAQLQREAEAISAAENKPFEVPCDASLLKYLEEVGEKIQPLPTTREQVKALAM